MKSLYFVMLLFVPMILTGIEGFYFLPWLHADHQDSIIPLKQNLDLPFDAGGGGGEEEEATEFIIFYGQIYEGDGFFYCIDGSLSMADGEFQILKRELARNIREFSPRVQFGIVFFNKEIAVFPADKKPASATLSNRQAAIAWSEELQPGNWTCLLEGLREALILSNKATVARKAVILMSDGKPACPGMDYVTYLEQIFREAAFLNSGKALIHAIGIGADVNEPFLAGLARQHGGTYRRIPH